MCIRLRLGVGLIATLGIACIPALGQDAPSKDQPAKAKVKAADETSTDGDGKSTGIAAQSELWKLLIDDDQPKVGSQARTFDIQSGGNDPVPLRQGSLIDLGAGLHLDLGMTRFDVEDNPGVDFVSVDPSLGADGSMNARMKIYDLSLAWDAYRPGPVTLSVVGGLKAVTLNARVNSDLVNDSGAFTGSESYGTSTLVPVPIVGGAVRWDISSAAWIRGTGTGHGLGDLGTYLDLTAEAGMRLTSRANMTAGYRFRQGQIDMNQFDADLNASSLFARFQLRF